MEHRERVEVRIRRILAPEGESTVAHTVYCPVHHESQLLVDCETCERCAQMNPDESFILCDAPISAPSHPLARIARNLMTRLLSDTTIGEVMTRDVVCVTTGLSMEAVSALLVERGFSGLPVVDAQGFPVGIVSKTDLVRAEVHAAGAHSPLPDLGRGFHEEPWAGLTAGEVMAPVAFTLEEKSPLGDAVKVMLTENVHRLPVVDQDGRVVGILSTMDVLRWLDG